MRTFGIDRVLIVVKDLDKAAERYSELLGATFEVGDQSLQEEQGVKAMLSWDGQIELVSPISAQSALGKFLETNGEGVFGVAWKVKDIDEASAEVIKKGFRVMGTYDFSTAPGFKLFKEISLHPEDFNGINALLVQTERE